MFLYFDLQDSCVAESFEELVAEQDDLNKQLKRTQPYILKFGQSLFIFIDRNTLVVKPASLSVAVDHLLKSFFVFDVQYPHQTHVLQTLMQHILLGIPGKLSAMAMKLHTELNLD